MSKEEKTFSFACFPVGTVCELMVEHVHKAPITITVAELVKNGPQSYIIVDKDNEGSIGGFNISHVTRIIKRGPGAAVITEHDRAYANVLFEKLRRDDYDLGLRDTGKHWVTLSPISEVSRLIKPFLTQDMLVDQAMLMGELRRTGLLSFKYDDNLNRNVFKLSKRNIKSKLKRLIPKALLNHRRAQREDDAMNDAFSYADPYDQPSDYDMEEPTTVVDPFDQPGLPI